MDVFKYKCMKCGTLSDEKSWIKQSMESIGTTEDDIEPLSNIDFDHLEYNGHGYDCPNCLQVCYTNEEDIEKIKI